MAKLISESARTTKSFRGAKAFIAKTPIKFSDDEHESSIKKGEKFYLKKLGKRYYLIDVEQEGGKEVWYQFKIEEKDFNTYRTKHTKASDTPKAKTAKKAPAKKPAAKRNTVDSQISKYRKQGLKTVKDFKAFTGQLKKSGYKPQKPTKRNGLYRLTLKNRAGKTVTFKYKDANNKHIQSLLGK